MSFPLSLWDISLWLAVMAIILLTTSELVSYYSQYLGGIVIEKDRLRLVAIMLGASFMFTVILRVMILP